jgi:hypothetical protein
MSISTFFKTALTDIVKAEHAVVSVLEKAAGAVPEVEAAIAKYGPEIGAVASTLIPASGQYTQVAINAAVVIGNAIESGGAAAEQQFLNLGADQNFINEIKSLWGNLQAASKGTGTQSGTNPPITQ